MAVAIVEAICSELKGDPVGTGPAGDSVFDTLAPSDADPPYVTVQQFESEQSHDQSGASGLELKRIQINAYEATAVLARALRDAIVTALDGNVGAEVGNVPNNMTLVSLLLVDDFPDFVPPLNATDVPAAFLYRLEFEGWHA